MSGSDLGGDISKTLLLQPIVFLYIIGMLGAHEPVPKAQVKAVIALEFAVMKIMEDRGVEYFKQDRMPEPAWHNFIS